MRLFVAVPAPVPEVRDAHVTLCFLGEVPDERADEVAGALAAGLEGARACEAEVAAGRARALGPTAVVRTVRGLDDLAARVRAAVGSFVARPDGRAFRGHLTVARRRRGAALPATSHPARRWRVEEVVLVRSELGRGPGGTARHTVVASVPLGGTGD